jgi:AraC-like DNA-binding protein
MEALPIRAFMSADFPADSARFYRPRFLPEVELVSVAYNGRRFPEHSHEEYVIGAVTTGAEMLAVGRNQHIADVGTVLRLNPAEAHANTTIGMETLRYSVLYVPKIVVASFLDSGAALPKFYSPVSKQVDLFRQVRAVHAVLACEVSGKLEQESALSLLVQALQPHPLSGEFEPAPSHAAADNMRQFIEEHYAGAFGLHDLGKLTGLSTFHLVRTFKKRIGLSPLAYRDQLRMAEARRLLLARQPISQISLTLGYADQSHFTRQFQRVVGTSPQRYARDTA